ncbi:MAG: hypothetical protein IKC74_04275 [Clostridia bacterium]|nr:hypothetical protein [Clostridia bacterium]
MNNEFKNRNSEECGGESNNAKRLRMLGDSSAEAIHLEENKNFKGAFWPNLWFKYKWHIIITSAFLIIFIVFLIQYLTATKYDVGVFYAGPEYVVDLQDDFSKAFGDFTKDRNNDGEKNVLVTSTVVMTLEQQKAAANGNQYDYLALQQSNKDTKRAFSDQMMAGNIAICLVDPHLYEEYSEAFVNVSEVLGKEVDSSLLYAPNAIYFKRTEFAKYYECFKRLPNDTLLCIMLNHRMTDEDEKIAAKELYTAILNFEG